MSLRWSLQSLMACDAVPPDAAGASAGTPNDRAQPSARTVIARRVIAASLWGNPVIKPHQAVVVPVLAELFAGPREHRRRRAARAGRGRRQSSERAYVPSGAGRSRASVAPSPTSSGRPPRSEASTGTPAASASSTEYGHGSSQREGASTTAARRRRSASSPEASRPTKRTSAPAARSRRRGLVGTGAGDHQRDAGASRGGDRGVESLLLGQAAGGEGELARRRRADCASRTRHRA